MFVKNRTFYGATKILNLTSAQTALDGHELCSQFSNRLRKFGLERGADANDKSETLCLDRRVHSGVHAVLVRGTCQPEIRYSP